MSFSSRNVFPNLEPVELGAVVALHLKPARGELCPVQALEAVANRGFLGDRSFGKRKRQVSIVSMAEMRQFGYVAGEFRENVTVDFEGLQELPAGTVLRIGTTELVIESDCQPCGGLARRLGEDPKEFMKKMKAKRGMLAKVARTGSIRVGDVVHLVRG